MTHRHAYIARINRVVDHIDAHLAEPLDLHKLAAVAHFSPWHFHRIFQALTGETLAERVRRRRLEVAAGRLLASPPAPALNIALDVGFASPEVFTRAFRAHFGVTPSAWRRGAYREWTAQHRAQLSKIHQADRKARQAVADGFRDDAHAWPVESSVNLVKPGRRAGPPQARPDALGGSLATRQAGCPSEPGTPIPRSHHGR